MEQNINAICGLLTQYHQILASKPRTKAYEKLLTIRKSFNLIQFYLYDNGREKFDNTPEEKVFHLIKERRCNFENIEEIWKPWKNITEEEKMKLEKYRNEFEELYLIFKKF